MVSNAPRRFSWLCGFVLLVTRSAAVAHANPTGRAIVGILATTALPLQIDLNPLPDPVEAVKDIIKSGINDILEGVAGLIDQFNWLVFSLPAPGDPQQPATWAAYPWEGVFYARWWNSVWEIYWGLAGVGTIGLAAIAVYSYSNRSTMTGAPIDYHGQANEALKAFGLVAFGWILLAAYVHSMNVLTIGMAPDGADFVASTGNLARFGIGFVLGVFLLAIDGGLVLIGVLVLLVQWVIMLLAYAMFPVAVIGRLSGSNYARVASDTVISLLIGLPILKFFQALVLRFVFSLPLGTGAGDLMTLLATIVGVSVAFLALPIKGTEMLLPNAVVATGGSLRHKGSDMGTSTDKQTAAAVQQQSTTLASQVRVGANSSAQRSQPNSRRSARGHSDSRADNSSSLPALADQSAGLPTSADAEPGTGNLASQSDTTGPPSVTVNTAVNTDNTAMAQAEASASSNSNKSHTGTNRSRRSPMHRPSLYRPLRRAKQKVENRRRQTND